MKKIYDILKAKWAEYLIEMIVIIAGILVAYGLNSWKDGKTRSERSEEYLNAFLGDLADDTTSFNAAIQRIESNFQSYDQVLTKEIFNQDLENIERAIMHRTTYNLYLGPDLVFQKMRNHGFHGSPEYEQIFDQLNAYYQSKLELHEIVHWDYEALLDAWSLLQQDMNFEMRSKYYQWGKDSLSNRENKKNDLIKFGSGSIYRNTILMDISRKHKLKMAFIEQKQEAEELIKMISERA